MITKQQFESISGFKSSIERWERYNELDALPAPFISLMQTIYSEQYNRGFDAHCGACLGTAFNVICSLYRQYEAAHLANPAPEPSPTPQKQPKYVRKRKKG